MDFLSGLVGHSDNKPSKQEEQQHHQQKPSSSELLSSAKLVAGAAQSTFNNESDKVDKGKVAGAGADLLGAASDYGKLDENKGFGKYVGKAEDYLHQYHSSHSTTTTAHVGSTPHSATEESGKHSSSHAAGGKEESGDNKYGEYFQMAQGFLKKN